MKRLKLLVLLVFTFIAKPLIAQNLSCDLIKSDFRRKVDFLTKKENKSPKIIDIERELLWGSDYAKTLIKRFESIYPNIGISIDSLISDTMQIKSFCELKKRYRKNKKSNIEYSYSKPLYEIETDFYFILKEIYLKPKNWNEGCFFGAELIMYRKKGNEFLKIYSVFEE